MDNVTVREDGSAEAFYHREAAWHGKGVVVKDAPNSEEAIRLAQLDWEVDTQPLFVSQAAGAVPLDSHVATYRKDSGVILGVVGSEYRIVQNAEAFAIMDQLVQDGSLKYETAFSLRGGARVVLTARLPGMTWEVSPGDEIQPWVVLSTSHDGTGSLKVLITYIRVVCENTLNAADAKGGHVLNLSLRHTAKVKDRASEAMRIIGRLDKVVGKDRARIGELVRQRMDQGEWLTFMDELFPVPPARRRDGSSNAKRVEMVEATRDRLEVLWHSPRQTFANEGRTAWAALNAVTEWVDHESGYGDGTGASFGQFRSLVEGHGAKLKSKAYDLACELVGAGEEEA